MLLNCSFFLLLVCWVGLWGGRGEGSEGKGALGVGGRAGGGCIAARCWHLQSWGDRFDLCCSCYLYKGKERFILESANRKVLVTVGDVLYLQLGL